MLAAFIEDKRVVMRDVPAPKRQPGFALIRVIYAGVCNTDLELLRGYYNFSGVPGHEFVGQVVEAGTPELLGKRVVGEINIACGECEFCVGGMQRHCARRSVLGIVNHPGAFAEYLTLPERNLHIVPQCIPDEHAVFTEPVAAAAAFLNVVRLEPHDTVAVLGDGKLGLLIAQALQAHGCRVDQYGRHAGKLAISKARGIHTHLERPSGEFGWVVEATGTAEGLAEAVRMTKPRGTVILKSTVHGSVAIDTAPVVVNELNLVGSRCGPFEPALDLLRNGEVAVGDLISETLPLSEAPAAFAHAARKGVLKVLLKP